MMRSAFRVQLFSTSHSLSILMESNSVWQSPRLNWDVAQFPPKIYITFKINNFSCWTGGRRRKLDSDRIVENNFSEGIIRCLSQVSYHIPFKIYTVVVTPQWKYSQNTLNTIPNHANLKFSARNCVSVGNMIDKVNCIQHCSSWAEQSSRIRIRLGTGTTSFPSHHVDRCLHSLSITPSSLSPCCNVVLCRGRFNENLVV